MSLGRTTAKSSRRSPSPRESCRVTRLRIAFSVATTDDGVRLTVDGVARELSSTDAAALRAALGEAVGGREAFCRTAAVCRPDGSYGVARRDAQPAKVFDSLATLRRLYDRLPDRFTAADLGETAAALDTPVSGSRRQLVVRHLAEHPRFDCTLACRNPLTAEKC